MLNFSIKSANYGFLFLILFFLMGCSYSWKQALEDSSDPRVEKRRQALDYFVKYVTENIGRKGKGAIERRVKAVEAIGDTGLPRAVNTLRMVLMHEKVPSVRVQAIKSLALLKAPQALEELKNALEDRDINVRMRAAAALGRLGDKRAIQALFRALGDRQASVRAASVSALADLKAHLAIQRLIHALADPDLQVQRAAQSALLSFKEEAIPPLIEELKKGGVPMAKAVDLLPRFGEMAFRPLVAVFPKRAYREGASEALARLTSDRTSWLLLGRLVDRVPQPLKEGEKRLAPPELEQLTASGSLDVVRAIIQIWHEIHVVYRPFLRKTLGEIARRYGDKGRLILAKAASEGKDLALRSTAIFALGYTGTGAIPHLKPYLTYKNRVFILSAIHSLGRIGKPALPELLPFFLSSDEEVRYNAILAAQKIKDPRVVDKLIEQLKHPSAKIREMALKCLMFQEDRKAIPAVRKLLSDPINNVMMTAIQTLIHLGDRQNIKLYITALDRGPYPPNPSYVKTLGELGDQRIIPTLKKIMKHYLRDWRRYVRKARRVHQRKLRIMQVEQAAQATKDALKDDIARQPDAICSFIEAMKAMLRLGNPVQQLFRKMHYRHSRAFNPLRETPPQCPWPSLESSINP